MIGGRVLDTTAVVAFAQRTSVYASAFAWTATEEDVVLLVPASVVAEARRRLDDPSREVLDVLLALPVTVVDPLGVERAASLPADLDLADAHALACSAERGWPLVTSQPDRYAAADVTLEEIP